MFQGNPMFVQSERTQKLVEALRGVNHEITYDALSSLIGFPVLEARPALSSARRILKAREQIVFDVIRGEGLRRLDGREKVGLTIKNRRGIHNASKRGMKNVDAITDDEYMNLSAPEQLTAQINNTVFRAVADATSMRKLPKLDKAKVDNSALSQSLASAKSLALTDASAPPKPKAKPKMNADLTAQLAALRRS